MLCGWWTVQKGLDPRDFALVPFGGAGPLHGNAMAMLAGCYPVIVPPTPGVLSALGFLYSDVKNEFAQTFVRTIDDADVSQIGDILASSGAMPGSGCARRGSRRGRQRLNYEADVRYFRQGYEFSLEIDPDRIGGGGLDDLAARFGLAHERIYGFKLDQPVELVNLRAVGIGAVQKISLPKFDKDGPDAAHAVVEQHQAFFDGNFAPVKVYERAKLRAGNRVRGPAIVVQMDATTVIHPQHTGEVDEYLSILIRRRQGVLRTPGETAMANFNPLSSTVSFDDLLKANKQQFDTIFSAQTKELGLLGVTHRPPTTADLASASVSSEAAAKSGDLYAMLNERFGVALVVGSGRAQNRARLGDRAVQAHGRGHCEDAIRLGARQRR